MEEKLVLTVSHFPELFDTSLRSHWDSCRKATAHLETNFQRGGLTRVCLKTEKVSVNDFSNFTLLA